MKRIAPLMLLFVFAAFITVKAQNVGISNTLFTPQSYLHVHQPNVSGNLIQMTNSTSGNGSNTLGLVFSVNGASYTLRNYQVGFMSFQTNASDFTFHDGTAERVRIQNGGRVGIGTAAPNTSALLHVNSGTMGILIPNVALTATNAAGPVASPATSLLVYNTATAGVVPNNVYPGYYYNAGTPAAPNWRRLIAGGSGGDGWLTTGNYGTNPTNNWIGTNDAQHFVFKTGGVAAANERMRITSAGNVLVNITAPLDATDAFTSVVSPTFPTAIAAYGNGGYPVWGEQQSGTATAVWGVNVAATAAGGGAGIYGYSSQTGAAGVIGDGNTTTRGVLGITNNATYAGVQGQNNQLDGDGVYGVNNATTGAGGGAGVYGYSAQTGAAGVWGSGGTITRGVIGINNNATYASVQAQNTNAGGDALFAFNSAANGAGAGSAIYAVSGQTGGATIITCMQSTSFYSNAAISAVNDVTSGYPVGVIGDVSRNAGIAIYGYNTAAAGAGDGNGVYGATSQSLGFGSEGFNANSSGTGVMGTGNNTTGSFLTTGSGGAFTGTTVGSYSFANNATGTGVLGAGNNQTAYTIAGQGSGGAFTGDDFGVYGFAVNSGNDTWGGYFDHGGTAFAYVGGRIGGTDYKIYGSGTVSTIVKDLNNNNVGMFCPEAPEILFQDYGTGKLVNGKARIELDPVLIKNIYVDDQHPLKVFIQLEGDCNGVYVTNKSQNGFDVIELQGGSSNVPFSWSIVASRADSKDDMGNIDSKHVGVRFPDAPEKQQHTAVETGSVKSKNNYQSSEIRKESTPVSDDSVKNAEHKAVKQVSLPK
jgi:hypothetical protein